MLGVDADSSERALNATSSLNRTVAYETPEQGISYLRRLIHHNSNPQFAQMAADGDAVHRQFGRLFHPDNLHRLPPLNGMTPP